MGTRLAIFFHATDAARGAFAAAQTLPQWYDALGSEEALEGKVSLHVGQSIACWRAILEDRNDALYPLFFGEFGSDVIPSTTGDPDVYFLGADAVARAAAEFVGQTPESLRQRYPGCFDHPDDIEEFLAATQAFVAQAAEQRRAMVGVWG